MKSPKITPLTFFQVRYDSFKLGEKGPRKSRRGSTRSKKGEIPSNASWPHSSPVPYDLAYAGFFWNPTSASPDNVTCFACGCQLDGWEASDVPAFEHLTHSPDCGFAINVCIRLRSGDPERVEEDPLSDKMKKARLDTFGNNWPLDPTEGFPSVEQLVDAGWYYDPTEETRDGATCPYCSLSLDSWDAGDDPLEEHRRRMGSCLFFTLKELYHPVNIPHVKPKAKRASTRGKRASTASTAKKPAKSRKASTESVNTTLDDIKPKRGAKRKSESLVEETIIKRSKRESTRGKRAPSIRSKRSPSLDWPTIVLPDDAIASTPKRIVEEKVSSWDAVDVENFFKKEDLPLISDLTREETHMTVEEFLLHEARRQESILREKMMEQVVTLDGEYKRALTAIEAM